MRIDFKNKKLLYAVAAALILIIVVVAVAVAFVPQPKKSNIFTSGNIDAPFNQVILSVQFKGHWAGLYGLYGLYGEPNSTQYWSGRGDNTTILNRPNGTSPWIIVSTTQGLEDVHNISIMTVSIQLLNGTTLKSVSGEVGWITLSLNVDVDNPARQVT